MAAAPDRASTSLGRALGALIDRARDRKRAAATLEFLDTKARHLVRLLGERRDIGSITLAHTEQYIVQRMGEGAAMTTAAKELGVLRAALRHAARHGLYAHDPAAIMPSETRAAYVPRDRWMPHDEYLRLLAALDEDRRDYVAAFCHLGARRSELYRLRASDVDLAGARVHVRGTKTKRSDRWVPLSAEALDVLARRMRAGRPVLFPEWPNIGRDLGRACRRAGIERVSPIDLRRTFCSWLANAGVRELVAARLMGHASTAMVSRVYAQLSADTERAAIALLPTRRSRIVANGSDERGGGDT